MSAFERDHGDYILIAEALRGDAAEQGAYDQWNTTVLAFANVLARDNPRFDRERFLRAAGAQL